MILHAQAHARAGAQAHTRTHAHTQTYARTQALALTAPEVSILEKSLTELHGMMRAKRSKVHALEEDLEAINPEVFGAVQVRVCARARVRARGVGEARGRARS